MANQSGVLDAQQNSRFAISSLERELRVAGVGVVDQQPLLVMANKLAITFNANLVALDTGDMGSVYINPDADSAAVDVLRQTQAITLTDGGHAIYPQTARALGDIAAVGRRMLEGGVRPRLVVSVPEGGNPVAAAARIAAAAGITPSEPAS